MADDVAFGEAEHLLGSGHGVFFFAEFGGVALGLTVVEFDQFVDRAVVGGVDGCGELGSDAEGIDGGVVGDEFKDLVFVEVAGGHNFGVGQAGLVEDTADGAGEFDEVAAVEANAPKGGPRAARWAPSSVS